MSQVQDPAGPAPVALKGPLSRLTILALLAAVVGAALLPGCSTAEFAHLRDTRLLPKSELPAPTAGMPAEDREAFDEGVALVTQLRYGEAQQRFQRVLRWFQALGDSPMAAETLFWLGFCNEKQGRTAQAWDYYDRLLKQYPTSAAAGQAARRRAALPPIGRPPAGAPPAGPPVPPAVAPVPEPVPAPVPVPSPVPASAPRPAPVLPRPASRPA